MDNLDGRDKRREELYREAVEIKQNHYVGSESALNAARVRINSRDFPHQLCDEINASLPLESTYKATPQRIAGINWIRTNVVPIYIEHNQRDNFSIDKLPTNLLVSPRSIITWSNCLFGLWYFKEHASHPTITLEDYTNVLTNIFSRANKLDITEDGSLANFVYHALCFSSKVDQTGVDISQDYNFQRVFEQSWNDEILKNGALISNTFLLPAKAAIKMKKEGMYSKPGFNRQLVINYLENHLAFFERIMPMNYESILSFINQDMEMNKILRSSDLEGLTLIREALIKDKNFISRFLAN